MRDHWLKPCTGWRDLEREEQSIKRSLHVPRVFLALSALDRPPLHLPVFGLNLIKARCDTWAL